MGQTFAGSTAGTFGGAFGGTGAGPGIDTGQVAALADEVLDWRFKALPPAARGLSVRDYLATGPTLAGLGTPLLTLDAAAVEHNVRTMADWCAGAGVALAPHGKTTMAPALWQAQLAAGAHGITLANLPQVRVARAFGVRRILLANTLLDPAGLGWLADELAADPAFAFLCWVDSAESVRLMDGALRAAGAGRPVEVLVELGGPGGRTGARGVDAAVEVAAAVLRAPTLRLAGIGGYEGALAHDATDGGLEAVRGYLRALAELHGRLAAAYSAAAAPVVSAGGSAYFDLVVEELSALPEAVVVLRSGAYVAHDDGFYRGISPFVRGAGGGTTPFRSALHGWARVVSRPEPQLALLDAGKRDLPFDEGLPEPQLVRGGMELTGTAARITALNDQHAFLRDAGDLAPVGAVLRLGISHPCTAFDRWTMIPVLDDSSAAEPKVTGLVRTFF
ncbi:amino acid deaminase [Kitasatospora sp. NPDC127111]|uniref:amino acid deaminase n=1 Tax=Kitasatospora sp. NPDC127111 TaxID=3345363 RepID=UPI00362CE83E